MYGHLIISTFWWVVSLASSVGSIFDACMGIENTGKTKQLARDACELAPPWASFMHLQRLH